MFVLDRKLIICDDRETNLRLGGVSVKPDCLSLQAMRNCLYYVCRTGKLAPRGEMHRKM